MSIHTRSLVLLLGTALFTYAADLVPVQRRTEGLAIFRSIGDAINDKGFRDRPVMREGRNRLSGDVRMSLDLIEDEKERDFIAFQ